MKNTNYKGYALEPLMERFAEFLKDSTIKSLSVPCDDLKDRDVLREVIMLTGKRYKFNLESIDLRVIKTLDNNKFFILEIEDSKSSDATTH